MSKGIIYIVAGQKYIDEACQSASSVKRYMPELPITIFSDHPVESKCFDNCIILENNYYTKNSYNFLDKVINIARSPYDYTLYLDSDTYICADISEMFDLLDIFDIAGSHSPGRISSSSCYQIQEVPESFAQLNAGVILFRKTFQVDDFLKNWLTLYKKDIEFFESLKKTGRIENLKFPQDQPSLRESLYKSSLRIATLPPEYNCRFIFPFYVSREVKILHGRHTNLPELAKEINKTIQKRVFVPNIGIITDR